MILNLYETHLQVSNLENSISFYRKLGLQLSLTIKERKVAFFYIGEEKQLLGLWEANEGKAINPRHFAFGTDLAQLVNSIAWLRERNIEPICAFGKEPTEPIVHTWMPAASVYFNDPDGNELEFIAWLKNDPKDIGFVPYLSEWEEINKV